MSISSLVNDTLGLVKEHPIATAVGATGVAVGTGLGAAAIVGLVKSRKNKRNKSGSSRKRGRRIKHTKRGWTQDRKRKSKQKWEVAYRKRKMKKSNKRRGKVYYAKKTGQPYIILASGKAKFIKRKRRK